MNLNLQQISKISKSYALWYSKSLEAKKICYFNWFQEFGSLMVDLVDNCGLTKYQAAAFIQEKWVIDSEDLFLQMKKHRRHLSIHDAIDRGSSESPSGIW